METTHRKHAVVIDTKTCLQTPPLVIGGSPGGGARNPEMDVYLGKGLTIGGRASCGCCVKIYAEWLPPGAWRARRENLMIESDDADDADVAWAPIPIDYEGAR